MPKHVKKRSATKPGKVPPKKLKSTHKKASFAAAKKSGILTNARGSTIPDGTASHKKASSVTARKSGIFTNARGSTIPHGKDSFVTTGVGCQGFTNRGGSPLIAELQVPADVPPPSNHSDLLPLLPSLDEKNTIANTILQNDSPSSISPWLRMFSTTYTTQDDDPNNKNSDYWCKVILDPEFLDDKPIP